MDLVQDIQARTPHLESKRLFDPEQQALVRIFNNSASTYRHAARRRHLVGSLRRNDFHDLEGVGREISQVPELPTSKAGQSGLWPQEMVLKSASRQCVSPVGMVRRPGRAVPGRGRVRAN